MPPLPFVANVAKLTFRQLLGEDADAQNRLFVNYGGPGTLTNAIAVALATTAAAAWNTWLAPHLTPDVTLTDVECQDLSTAVGGAGSVAVSDAGTSGGTILPAEVCMVIQFLAEERYRGGHPRWYQSGLDEAALADAQTWTTGTISAWGTAFTNFVNAILAFASGGYTIPGQCFVNYYHGFTVVMDLAGYAHNRPTVKGHPTSIGINGITVNPKVGSQRRRSLQNS